MNPFIYENNNKLFLSSSSKILFEKIAIIEFDFKISEFLPNQNIFQTSHANNGIRLEISKDGFAELIFNDYFYGIKHCTFFDKLDINKYYHFYLKYDFNKKEVFSYINNSRICYHSEYGFIPKFDQIIFGNGGWWTRVFNGDIKNTLFIITNKYEN